MTVFIPIATYALMLGVILRLSKLANPKHEDAFIVIACFWPIILVLTPFVLLGWLGNWITGKIIRK